MNYITLPIGDKEYKLILTTRGLVELERKLGYNPVEILMRASEGTLPKVSEMVYTFWASCLKYNHSVNVNNAFDIFDEYIAEGHNYTDFIEVMVNIFKASGLIPEEELSETAEDEKN